ncbi:MAG TPA: hypothetical protein VFU98_11010, partial [Microlunatus sp.]|nr:hypothetical protein [Microlunatus sp.]
MRAMSATRMTLDGGRLLLETDSSGRLLAVRPRSRPEIEYLSSIALGACRIDGVDHRWSVRETATDADEITAQAAAGGLEASLRHSVSTGWTTRILLVNPGAAPLTVDRLQLAVRLADGQRASGVAAGSRLCWAVQPRDGDGPLLGVRCTAGGVSAANADGFELGPLRLSAGQRYVTQLRWELYATARSVVSGPGRDVLVIRTVFEVGESVLLPDDPDAALVVPPEVAVDTVDDPEFAGREVSVHDPGRHRLELRSAEGDVRLDLSWVRPLTEQLRVWATALLAGPRTAAGVAVVDDLAAAIVLQAALGSGALDDAEQAADALDRQTARLLDRFESGRGGALGPFEVLYLLGEHGRSGDPDVLDLALTRETDLVARAEPAPPGLGLAVLRTVLAAADAPERVATVVQLAIERVIAGQRRAATGGDAEDAEDAARLELLLAVRPLLPADDHLQQQVSALVRRLGAALGAGLPGRLLTPPPPAEHAHLVAVLRMLPEDGVPGVTRTWGTSSTLLAARVTSEVLDRLSDRESGDAAAWLA